jgi:hypothetical protein
MLRRLAQGVAPQPGMVVRDIENEIRKLDGMGVDTGSRSSKPRIKTVMVSDPDGNHIALAEALDPALTK